MTMSVSTRAVGARPAYKEYFRKFGMYVGLLAVFATFSILSPYFFNTDNILNIIVQSSIIAIIASGQTVVILTGGIDLSVGSIVAFVTICTGLLLSGGVPIPLVVLLGILVGLVMGLINALGIAFGRVPPFIMTLGMMGIARGAALAANAGRPVAGFPDAFETIATASVWGIPVFVIYSATVFATMYVVLNRTRTGRYIYAVGGNRSAARLSGVKVKYVEAIAYAFSGLFAGIGGVLLTARLNYATPLAGSGYELDTIAAVVIGGTALAGGEGNIVGTLVGSLMLGTLRNGLTLLNVSNYVQQMVIGLVIISAVFVDKMRSTERE